MDPCTGSSKVNSDVAFYKFKVNTLFRLLIYFLFAVLPVKVNEKSAVIRHFFLKMHITREKCPQKPEYQTLFVVGVPEFCDQVISHSIKIIYILL